MTKAVIIVGSPADSATQCASALAQHFGKTDIEHADLPADFYTGGAFPDNALVLTTDDDLAVHHKTIHGATVYTFKEAALAAGLNNGMREPVDGVLDGYAAVRVNSSLPHVAVLDSVGKGIFTLPVDYTAQQVNTAIRIYEQAWKCGHAFGADFVRHSIRNALGIV
jgi:hypothetical protein